MNVHPIINQIVNRRHVSESNAAVIRHVVSRLQNKYQTFKGMPKKDRKAFMQQVIFAHGENKTLYRDVMSGGR